MGYLSEMIPAEAGSEVGTGPFSSNRIIRLAEISCRHLIIEQC